jgi:hypothetical protein
MDSVMVVIPNFTGHRKDEPTLRDYFTIWNLMKVYPRSIMEMGIDAGGSLLLWNDMFAPHTLVGLDINMDHAGLERLKEFDNIHIFPFDQMAKVNERTGKLDGLLDILTELGTKYHEDTGKEYFDAVKFDLIIDDCIHNIDGAMNSLFTLWPDLNPGGAYIIEDWNQDDVYAKTMTRQCLDRLDYWRNVDSVTVTGSLIGLVKGG